MKLFLPFLALCQAAVFDETEADYTVIVGAGKRDCYFQPMNKGYVALHPALKPNPDTYH